MRNYIVLSCCHHCIRKLWWINYIIQTGFVVNKHFNTMALHWVYNVAWKEWQSNTWKSSMSCRSVASFVSKFLTPLEMLASSFERDSNKIGGFPRPKDCRSLLCRDPFIFLSGMLEELTPAITYQTRPTKKNSKVTTRMVTPRRNLQLRSQHGFPQKFALLRTSSTAMSSSWRSHVTLQCWP